MGPETGELKQTAVVSCAHSCIIQRHLSEMGCANSVSFAVFVSKQSVY